MSAALLLFAAAASVAMCTIADGYANEGDEMTVRKPIPDEWSDWFDGYEFGTLWEVQHGDQWIPLPLDGLCFDVDLDGWILQARARFETHCAVLLTRGHYRVFPIDDRGLQEVHGPLGQRFTLCGAMNDGDELMLRLPRNPQFYFYDDPKPTIRFGALTES